MFVKLCNAGLPKQQDEIHSHLVQHKGLGRFHRNTAIPAAAAFAPG
jgi:hypothetical protein